MPIDIDIEHVARLARLELTCEELDGYKAQLGVILEHAARVQGLENGAAGESAHPLELTNRYREDDTTPSLDRDEVLAQAPDAEDGYFTAPPALEIE